MDAEMRREHGHNLRTLVWNKSSVTRAGRVLSCDCGFIGIPSQGQPRGQFSELRHGVHISRRA